jgi:hypothetical protein
LNSPESEFSADSTMKICINWRVWSARKSWRRDNLQTEVLKYGDKEMFNKLHNILMCMSDYRRGWDCWLELLTTYRS